jgi:hypothetical protein
MASPRLARLCVKQPDPQIKYHYSDPIAFNEEKVELFHLNFHIPTLLKEAKKLPRKKVKEYKKTIQTFLMTASSFLVLPLRSMANTGVSPNVPATSTLPNHAEGIPPEILELLLKLLVISVGTAMIFGIILLVAAGVQRMLGNKKGATEWTTDIIRGLIQVMIASPVVFLVYYIISLLFRGSGWFVTPF